MFDRDGNWLVTCVKGDPYIMDMFRTDGHCALVTGVQWHPSAPNVSQYFVDVDTIEMCLFGLIRV